MEDCYCLLRNQKLVAYVVKPENISSELLNNHLKSELPGYPIPYKYVSLSALPLTDSGEVDEKNLVNIAVMDAQLIPAWEEQIISKLEIEQAAILIEPKQKKIPPIHLEKLLPSTQVIFNKVSTTIETSEVKKRENNGSQLRIKPPAISHGEALIFPESAPKTLGEMLQKTAGKFPHKGITYINSNGYEEVQSYPQLLEDAQRILSGLRKLGLKPQDKVIFQLKENRDFINAFWGCVLGGFIPVPVEIPLRYDQNNANLNKLQNSWDILEKPLILTDKNLLPQLSQWFENLNNTNFKLQTIENLKSSLPNKDYYNFQSEDLAVLMPTSGSTGIPKAVMLSNLNLLSMTSGTINMNGFTCEDITLNWMPMDHVGALVFLSIMAVDLGCQQIHTPTEYILQNPLNWLDLIARHQATVSWAPNFAFNLLCDRADEINHKNWNLSSMKFLVNAGEAIVAKTARNFLKLLAQHQLPSTVLHPAFGMCETCSGITWSNNFSLETNSDENIFVSVGSPIPGASIRITDENGNLVQEKTIGWVELQGSSVTKGYYQNKRANNEAFTEDGWFKTGDLGFIQEGRLTITGRKKDVIIVNGANYYSHEIEAAVEELASVEVSYTAACGVSVAGKNTEELVIFFVPYLSKQNQLPSLLKKIREKVVKQCGINPSYLIPLEKERIPKTSIGKIQRSLLKQSFMDGEFTSIRQEVDLLLENANTIPNWFYRKVWQKKQSKTPLVANPSEKSLTLIFADNLGLAAQLQEELSQQNQPYAQVTIGYNFACINPNHYSLAPENPQHYRLLIDSLLEKNQKIGQIIHLWDYKQQEEISSLEELESTQKQGVYSLLSLVQALEKTQGSQHRVKLLWIANNSQSVNPTDKIEPQKATVLGLLKTIAQEKSWLTTRHLDLLKAEELNSSYIWQELYSVDNELEVAIRDKQRFVSRLETVNMTGENKQEIPIKTGGTYLLTGGLGGIGTIIAKYLLENYQANLILVGRTQLEENNQQVRAKIRRYQELEKLPGSIIYQAVDICDLVGLQQVVEKATSQWGTQLDGVIHMAGIIQEKAIEEETPSSIAAVLRPKVSGTWVLHQLLKHKEDALFIHFCSAYAFFGGDTVAAYAAANSFQSAWGDYQYKNGFKSYCCSWSMWNETGMAQGYQFLQEIIRKKGYFVINTQQGINSFLAALSHCENNLLIGLDGTKANVEHLIAECQPKQKLTAYFTSDKPEINQFYLQNLQLQLYDYFGIPNQVDFIQLEKM
ncbi:MAG: SDR family NAD(P)-dependent oxidoreductase, partial [Cyanobacteria bacterium P01_A01_bin.68]